MLLVPAGGDVRLGAADWALETAKVTSSLSDERCAMSERASLAVGRAVLRKTFDNDLNVPRPRASSASTSAVSVKSLGLVTLSDPSHPSE